MSFKEDQITISTLENIPGMDIEQHLGMVSASASLGKSSLGHFFGGFKRLLGGEIESESKELHKLKEQAIERMRAQSKLLGANAIICVRLTIGSGSSNSLEAFAYGTAVKAVKF